MGTLPPLSSSTSSSRIYKVRRVGVRPVSARREQQLRKEGGWRAVDESRYLRLLRAQVATGALYFAVAAPAAATAAAAAPASRPASTLLHRRVALQQGKGPPAAATALAEAEEYVWNAFLLSGIEDPSLRVQWGTPCISGFAASSSRPLPLGNETAAVLTLVSRRSTRMQGTRFFRRGKEHGVA